MNIRLVAKYLGYIALLIGLFMILSLPWAWPNWGLRTDTRLAPHGFEFHGFYGLLLSALICWGVGAVLILLNHRVAGKIYHKEAMAVVALSWTMATVLGAFPYILSGTMRGPMVRLTGSTHEVLVTLPRWQIWNSWAFVQDVSDDEMRLIKALVHAGPRGLSHRDLGSLATETPPLLLFSTMQEKPLWSELLLAPGEGSTATPVDRAAHYRIQWRNMGLVDSWFESQSGFSTAGATVLTDLDDATLVPHCILFWRASTQFLGGLGIIVLFVAILGHGAAGKSLMRTEMPGPTKEGVAARMQHTAWAFAGVYCGLTVIAAAAYLVCGMSIFDALCHAFATISTGGFSTYNLSMGAFTSIANVHGPAIQYLAILFMVLSGVNFVLLYFLVIGRVMACWGDIEFRVYLVLLAAVSAVVICFGFRFGDNGFETGESGFRHGLFQVVSILTTTGFGTVDFDRWNQFNRGILLAIMFIGGCAGSTACGYKIIRAILLWKILRIELEQIFRPRVVRLLRVGDKVIEDAALPRMVLVYFALTVLIFAASWLAIAAIEPSETWGGQVNNKLIDSAAVVAASMNNIGPALGVAGPSQHYANFSSVTKILCIFLMLLGRLEILPILVLMHPAFWRDQ